MTIMVMPMAGDGKRMAGISALPKPLIQINGYPIFYWAAKNIKADIRVFVVRLEHVEKYQIDDQIKDLFPNADIVIQESKLDGQLLSVLLADKYLDVDSEIIIADCDMYSIFDSNELLQLGADASVLTFKNNSPNYSYVLKDSDMVSGIAEKGFIGDDAIAGIFYWKNGKTFLKYAKDIVKKNIRAGNEFYVSTVYAEAIKNGLGIKTLNSKITYDLSTIDGIESFERFNG